MIRNLLLTFIVFVLSGFILWMTLQRLDPVGINSVLAYFSFFVSLFLFVSLFMTFVFFFASEMRSRRKLGTRYYLVALRRGGLVGLFVCGILVLQLLQMISLVQCGTHFTPETGCGEIILTGDGLFEIALWAIFLVMIELICESGRKKRL